MALLALVVGCQSASTEPEVATASTSEMRSIDVALGAGAYPDSVIVEYSDREPWSASSRTASQAGVRIGFQAPTDLGGDTLWLHLWSRGIRHLSIGFAKVGGTTAEVARVRSELAGPALARLDSLLQVGKAPAGTPAIQILSVMGETILEAGASTIGWWNDDLPNGITKEKLDSTLLASYVRRGTSLDSMVEAGKISLDRSKIQQKLADWLRDGLISRTRYDDILGIKPVDLVAPSIERLQPAAESLAVVWEGPSIDLVWKVLDDSLGVVRFGSTILSGTEGIYRTNAALAVGRNLLVLSARDVHGNEAFDSLVVWRTADTTLPTVPVDTADTTLPTVPVDTADTTLPTVPVDTADTTMPTVPVDTADTTLPTVPVDSTAPTLIRVLPTQSDTVLPMDTTGFPVAWKVADADSLALVMIQSVPVFGSQGVFRAMVALTGDSTWIRIDAIDLSGNRSTDSVLVRRLAPPVVSPASAGLDSAITVRAEAKPGVLVQYAAGSSATTWTTYTAGIAVTSSSSFLFRSVLGGVVSPTVERVYAFAPRIAPSSKSFTAPESIRIAPEGDASIEYSTDGATWKAYVRPFVISKSTKVQARSRIGDVVSPAVSVQYEHVPLTILPASGGYSSSQQVEISAAPGTSLEYALGTATNWVPWTGVLSIGGNAKVFARVARSFVVDSVEYAFAPRVIPAGKSFALPESLTVVGTGADALEISLDGKTWMAYPPKIFLNRSMTVQARARVGSTNSPVVTQVYVHTPYQAFSGVGYEYGVEGVSFRPTTPTVYWMKGDSLWATGENNTLYGDGSEASQSDRKFLGAGFDKVWSSKGAPRITGSSTFFLKRGGELLAVGANITGALGDGTTNSATMPIHVMNGVRSVSPGVAATLVVTTGGALYAMGQNSNGSLGLGTTAFDVALGGPTLVMGSGVKQAVMGYKYSLVLRSDGSLWTAGSNERGKRGLGPTPPEVVLVDSNFTPLMTGVRSIAANAHFSLVVKDDGSLWGFGDNSFGVLGTGTTEDVLTPHRIMDGVDTVAIGERHALILKRSGELYVTGYGAFGALGTGKLSDATTPTLVAEDVEWISAGAAVSFFRLKRSGQLRAMGSNGLGSTKIFPGYAQAIVDSPLSMSW